MPKFDLVIFDFDGTIANSIPLIVQSLHQSLESNGLKTFAESDYKKLIGLPLPVAFEQLLKTTDSQIIEKLVTDYRVKYKKGIEVVDLFPGMIDLLKKLKASNIKLSIATGKSNQSISMNLEKLELTNLFDLVLGFDSVEKPKPDGQIVTKTLQELNVEAQTAIMIGDSHLDIQTGKNGGVKTLGVTWGVSSFEQMLDEEPDFIVENVKDLEDILI